MSRIEYRSAKGRKLEVAANGHLVSVAAVSDIATNLRNHGCPENLIERFEIRSRAHAAMRRGTPTEPSLAQLKAKAGAIGEQIEADNRKFLGR